jgi:hypothetical protein
MINTDQGCQYTSADWISYLKKENIAISMNGVGRSNDNAYVERLWRTVKYEGFVLYPFVMVAELKESIRQTIGWYNHQRPHSSLDGQTPLQKLQESSIKMEESTIPTQAIMMTLEQGTLTSGTKCNRMIEYGGNGKDTHTIGHKGPSDDPRALRFWLFTKTYS